MQARETDAVEHHLNDENVDNGHAYVYGLTKWLRNFIFPQCCLDGIIYGTQEIQVKMNIISMYKNEFINTYERDINLRNLRGDARRSQNIVSRWRILYHLH